MTGDQPIGRERELATMMAFVGAAPAGPAGLILSGSAGIGKTTLWLQGISLGAAAGLDVLTSRPRQAETTFAYAALGFDQELVGVVVLQRQAAIAALAAATRLTHQGGHERARGDRLAAALGASEHVGVVRPLGGAGQERHGDVLAGNGREDGLHPPMVARRCDHPARGEGD